MLINLLCKLLILLSFTLIAKVFFHLLGIQIYNFILNSITAAFVLVVINEINSKYYTKKDVFFVMIVAVITTYFIINVIYPIVSSININLDTPSRMHDPFNIKQILEFIGSVFTGAIYTNSNQYSYMGATDYEPIVSKRKVNDIKPIISYMDSNRDKPGNTVPSESTPRSWTWRDRALEPSTVTTLNSTYLKFDTMLGRGIDVQERAREIEKKWDYISSQDQSLPKEEQVLTKLDQRNWKTFQEKAKKLDDTVERSKSLAAWLEGPEPEDAFRNAFRNIKNLTLGDGLDALEKMKAETEALMKDKNKLTESCSSYDAYIPRCESQIDKKQNMLKKTGSN